MIYVCIPARDEAATVGLLLWKVRQVFRTFAREYHLVVADDGSTDATYEVLGPYARVLPLTLVRHSAPLGYAATLEEILRLALGRTDRPKRDYAIIMHADFSHDPAALPDLVRRIESGADIAVGEDPTGGLGLPLTERLLRRAAPWWLRPAVGVPGVHEVAWGFCAYRLSTLRRVFDDRRGRRVLTLEGWSANAELLGRARRQARRIEAVPAPARYELRRRPLRRPALARLGELWRARSLVQEAVA